MGRKKRGQRRIEERIRELREMRAVLVDEYYYRGSWEYRARKLARVYGVV